MKVETEFTMFTGGNKSFSNDFFVQPADSAPGGH